MKSEKQHEFGRKVASGVRRIRNTLCLTREAFAESSGLPLKLVEKLEGGVATKENLALAMDRLRLIGYEVEEFFNPKE